MKNNAFFTPEQHNNIKKIKSDFEFIKRTEVDEQIQKHMKLVSGERPTILAKQRFDLYKRGDGGLIAIVEDRDEMAIEVKDDSEGYTIPGFTIVFDEK